MSRVVASDQLHETVDELAGWIAAAPQYAVRMIKRAVCGGENLDLGTALDLISSHVAVVHANPESQAALTAVRERIASSSKENTH